jgi:hypothetical protein
MYRILTGVAASSLIALTAWPSSADYLGIPAAEIDETVIVRRPPVVHETVVVRPAPVVREVVVVRPAPIVRRTVVVPPAVLVPPAYAYAWRGHRHHRWHHRWHHRYHW